MTKTEQLNELAGSNIFATKLDQYGLPIDGWSLPTITYQNGGLVSCGVFRVDTNGELEYESVSQINPPCFEELLNRLIEVLKKS